jgi:hypothetical protein
MNARMNGCMDAWMHGRMDEYELAAEPISVEM